MSDDAEKDAREIAGKLAGVVRKIDQEPTTREEAVKNAAEVWARYWHTLQDGPLPKGHVPEENLRQYRRLKQAAETFGSLGGRVSGLGQVADANLCWALEVRYHNMANELRADLPQKEREEEE